MASKLLQLPTQTTKTHHSHNSKHSTTLSLSFLFTTQHQHSKLFTSFQTPKPHSHSKIPKNISPKCTLSSPKPPTTKEEAILQAKTSLSSTLLKPLNNPKLPGKLKKIKQPRLRLELPIIDDSPSSLSQLALQVFKEMSITKKGSKIKIIILWPNQTLTLAAIDAFGSYSSNIVVQNIDISSLVDEVSIRNLSSADVAVFLSPEASQLGIMKTISDSLSPRPVVIFNPKWGFEDEVDLGETMKGFVGSFDVVYSFTGLEVQGIFSKRKGVVFKCVRDGVLSGEMWNVFVEEEDGELKVVSRFKSRPTIGEVENVLYNMMAVNSPVTKSVKFLKNLVSNVTGKK